MTSDAPSGFFTSPRERVLWILALLVTAGIYSTLILASTLSGVLYNEALAAVLFLAAMAAIGIAVLTQGLKVRPGGVEIGLAVGIAAVYGMVFVRLAIPERSHLIEYGVLAVLVYEALAERARREERGGAFPLLAVALVTAVGALDEAIQILLPFRHYDPTDILFNFLAALGAVTSMVLLAWARRRFGRKPT